MPPAIITTQAHLESLIQASEPVAILFHASWNVQSQKVLGEFNNVSIDCALGSCELVDDLEDFICDLGVTEVPIVQIYGPQGKLLGQSIGGTMESADTLKNLIVGIISKSQNNPQDIHDKVRDAYAATVTGAKHVLGGADSG
eukprot:gnl/MRDRNA2_/MRDRNA2_102792_c0_seq1.p2 gnl/MRDRNA2_/MRDRNA2_102792_c0~~gnl/MRDRNA2_/MRDRNA2_102792_c0_seq1.p2  ORF type:complete len:142 (+),score=25.18 gnl/MRDRNA2_/MRDRNA2_102792_c0_seq1:204-629(+)